MPLGGQFNSKDETSLQASADSHKRIIEAHFGIQISNTQTLLVFKRHGNVYKTNVLLMSQNEVEDRKAHKADNFVSPVCGRPIL